MSSYYFESDRIAERQKTEYQRARYKEWLSLKKTEQALFIAVFKAWRRNKTEGRWNQADELSQWVTREQIARELDTFRLTPYNLKLLDHLTGGKSSRDYSALHWIQKAKRTRWRYVGMNKRPAGYEWCYYPNEEVIAALDAMNPNNQKTEAARLSRPVPTLPSAPKYRQPLWERVIDLLLSPFGY